MSDDTLAISNIEDSVFGGVSITASVAALFFAISNQCFNRDAGVANNRWSICLAMIPPFRRGRLWVQIDQGGGMPITFRLDR